jgi:hypothetical protein
MNLYIWDSGYLLLSAEGIRNEIYITYVAHFINEGNTSYGLAFVRQKHITLFQQQIQPPKLMIHHISNTASQTHLLMPKRKKKFPVEFLCANAMSVEQNVIWHDLIYAPYVSMSTCNRMLQVWILCYGLYSKMYRIHEIGWQILVQVHCTQTAIHAENKMFQNAM